MQDTITIRETFSSRDDAEDARERLESAGFSRNSMNLMRSGDRFELTIHTRPENRQRVRDCIEASDVMFEMRRYGREIADHAPSPGQSALLVGVIAAIGAGLYYAYTRQREIYAQTYPSRRRSAVRSLYEAHREEHEHGNTQRAGTAGQRPADRSPGTRSDFAGYGS
jgi:hypothetical protein